MDMSTKADVFANLDTDEVNPIIQEAYFIRYYLPFFRVPNPPMDAMTNLVQYHLSVTNNPYANLDVYRGNEFLFTVPPLYRDDLTDRLNSFGKKNLTAILAEISLCQQSGNTFDATRLSLNELIATVDDKQQINREHAAMWSKIFNYYNIQPVKYDPDGKVEVVDPTKEAVAIKDIQVNLLDEL